ncbi:cytochrome P450 736A117-like [Silene latifolia]|uniref:cytochrome P450 736A117-like n=1 Tax=Silene latifolia TaxID=37657 RepID=UPI003D76D416
MLHFYTILPFLIFLFFLYKLFSTSRSTGKQLPPSPKTLPIIGNLHQISRLPHRSLHSLSQQHGELMLVHFGRKPVLVVSSSKAACQIMKTHDTIFADRPQLKIFKRLIYNCKDIATAPYGDYWKHIRSICVLHLLSPKRVQSFHHIREEEVAHMIGEIEQSSSTTTSVNLSKLFVNFSSDIICRVAFGLKFKGETDGINFKELMERHEKLVGGIHIGEFIPWLSWINYVNGVESEIKKVAKDMNRCLEGIIQQHVDRRDQVQSGVEENNHDKSKDLVDVLLELQHDDMNNSSLDQESIKAIIMDMFVAGTTTTYATLEWAMSELLRSPKAMESVTSEVRRITGGKASIITDNKLEKMTYLKAVIKETFRLHPPVPLLLPRISMQDAKIHGYDIPARTLVMINAWAIHRDPTSWTEPEEFKPERFLDSPVDYKGQYFDLIPFGSGRRGCPGMLFAISNIDLALANLIDKFDWRLPDSADGNALDMTEYPGLTAHRAVPLLALATPRYG